MSSNLKPEEFRVTWQALTWRLLLTILLLLTLISAGLPIFRTITTLPNTQVLPTLTSENAQMIIR